MNAEEFAKVMSFMGLAYNKEFTQDQLGVWYAFFHNDEYADLKTAVTRLISRSKFMPTIAEIKDEMVTIRNPELQGSPEAGWMNVRRAIQMYGYSRCDEAMKSFDPITARAVKRMGGFEAICMSEDGDWVRRNFMQAYESCAVQARTDLLYASGSQTIEERRRISGLLEVDDGRRGFEDT